MLSAAVIGCGPRGIEHAQALRSVDGFDLVAVADRAPEAVRPATDALGVPGYLAIEELMERARPDIVVLATPVHGRAALTEQVAAFPGVRAIVAEKPMALTMTEAERMLAACDSRGIVLTVSHQWRFSRELEAVKAALDAGEVGAVEFLRGSCYGNLFRQEIHLLDAMRWLSGGREVLWVMSQWSDDPTFLGRHARGDRGYWDDTTHPAPMWMVHHLAFEGGLRATLETGLLYQRSRTFTDDWLQKRLTIIGSEGLAECQTAEHCKFLSTRRAGWTVVESGLDHYAAATRHFHAELRDALTTGIPHRNDARDALKTSEVALACAQSAADGALVALPLPRDRDPVSELEARRQQARAGTSTRPSAASISLPSDLDPTPPRPEISVIVALPDHRGLASECVESLTRQQTYPRDRYEVIVTTNGADPALDDRVKALLGPQDRIITHRTTNLYLLYHVGAREARGKLIFITEPHCIAEPTCLEELARFFDTHDYDGACCSSTGICPNAWARVERRYSETAFQVSSQPGHWRKVFWKGFAIYRDVYLEEGGLEPQFGRFSECVLGAKLHSRGRRLGYATRATVRHKYWTSPSRLFPFIRAFSQGECAYRMTAPVEYCERYFGHVEEWTHRESFRPALARVVCRAILWSLAGEVLGNRRWSMMQAQANAFLRLLSVALFGPHVRLLRYTWSVWTATARCALWRVNEERLYKACSDAFERIIRCTRLEFIAEHLAASIPEPPQATVYRLGEVQDEWLIGFHLVERWGGEAFRWSGPVALIRLGLSRAAYEVRVETRGLRQASAPLSLGVFFNRHRFRDTSLEWHNGALTFRIDASMFGPGPDQHLILTCNPVRPWTLGVPDRRKLGLPIFSIAFTRANA